MAQATPLRVIYNLDQYTPVDAEEGIFAKAEAEHSTDLIEAVIALCCQWRKDHEVYSVEVMQAMGRVIAETEKMFEFSP